MNKIFHEILWKNYYFKWSEDECGKFHIFTRKGMRKIQIDIDELTRYQLLNQLFEEAVYS